MSKHNYSQYSKKNNENNITSEAPVSYQGNVTVVEETVEPVTSPEVKMEPEVSTPATTTGIVANCAKLNVRANANTTADVVCILDAASEVTIDVENSTEDWFKVRTATGINGYCMRKFINADL